MLVFCNLNLEVSMASLVIKDLPPELHRRLKEEALKAHRSMTKEAIYLMEAGLQEKPAQEQAQEIPAPYRGKKPLTDKMIQKWKRQGMA
jgi:plasmid stability protein